MIFVPTAPQLNPGKRENPSIRIVSGFWQLLEVGPVIRNGHPRSGRMPKSMAISVGITGKPWDLTNGNMAI
jgi:hypothetical protein